MHKGRRQKLKNGDEEDAIHMRRWYHWKPGTLKKTKRAMNKRARKEPIT